MSTTPTQREALDAVLRAGRRSLHTCFPAKVLAYDVAAQTVDVEPQVMRELQDDEGGLEHERLPTLYDVPVQWYRGGGRYFSLPLKAGDFVEIVCAEQSLLVWRDKGEVSEPGVSQAHGLNGCMARPGWYPDTKKLANVSDTDLVIGKDDGSASIRIKPDGTIVLSSETGAQALALANLVDARLKVLQAAFDLHVHATAALGTPSPPIVPNPPPPGAVGVTIPIGVLASVAAKRVKAV